MVHLTKLRDLTVAEPTAPGRPLHLSAASGLVDLGGYVAVIADDELHIGLFQRYGRKPGRLVRVFDGLLPAENPDRKEFKPDLEVLMHVPSVPGHADGLLLAIGSGSTANRGKAVALQLDARGRWNRVPGTIDFQPLFEALRGTIPHLNIEGATIQDDEFRLFHRGTIRFPDSLVIRLPLRWLLAALVSRRMDAVKPLGVHRLDLGRIEGVPYSVTDAAPLPDGRTVVSAVAENTDNAYEDGACMGALIGVVDQQMHLTRTWALDPVHKVEGISASVQGAGISLLLVADADDPVIAASLFTATIPV